MCIAAGSDAARGTSTMLVILMLTTPPCGSVKAAKCVAAKRTEEKRGRGRAWVYIEMLCSVLAVTGVNQDLTHNKGELFLKITS